MLLTGAHSSRVKKSKKPANPLLRRSSSSPFSSAARRKPGSTGRRASSKSALEDDSHAGSSGPDDDRLDDAGVVLSLAALTDDEALLLRDAPQFIANIRARTFSSIPERAPGMNSTRIAEVLNFRASLPPLVTLAHVTALSRSPTHTDREVAELTRRHILRRVAIPSRGPGAANLGDGLVLLHEWESLVEAHPALPPALKSLYTTLLRAHPTSLIVPASALSPPDAAALLAAGLLTSAHGPGPPPTASAAHFSRPGASTLGALSALSGAGASAPSGTHAAVGGERAFSQHGGAAGAAASRDGGSSSGGGGGRGHHAAHAYTFSLPNTGPYLRLVAAARAHLVSLLRKASPRYGEATADALRERWDGGVAGSVGGEGAGKRGKGVLPGQTRKWRQFWGMRFEWVLEECVGAGMVECFETGSVGMGVRLAG